MFTTDQNEAERVVLIGYGNTLLGDDAVGPRVADAVRAWSRPGVVAIAVPQLLPELAERLASARTAIFVDAWMDHDGGPVRCTPVEPATATALSPHGGDPRSLLTLARDLFGRCPDAWLIAIPAEDFGLNERLSPLAARGHDEAIERIASLLGEEAACTRSA